MTDVDMLKAKVDEYFDMLEDLQKYWKEFQRIYCMKCEHSFIRKDDPYTLHCDRVRRHCPNLKMVKIGER